MSVSSLPEWKQLLLEKKRREEEERERREKEEEEKFASMPAWKRGIIQRRKMKQEINLGSEPSLSPDPALWLDAEPKPASQVSVETIVPVHENPFIRTQSAWRKGRDVEVGNEPEVKEREKDKMSPKGQDGESGRGRDIELKIERFRDLSEPREKERNIDRSQGRENNREGGEKDKIQWKESAKEQEFLKEVQTRADAGSESLGHAITPRSPKRIAPMGMSTGPLEIQIPRTVFYVAEEMMDRKKGQSGEGPDWEEGRGVERRDSWRIGKPLSRIESLREKIRQRELERKRQREAQDGGEATEINDAQAAEDRYEERGSETEKEWEAAAHVQRRQVEAERGQEDAAEQTVAADVKREVSVLKTCPQLPASQAVGAEEVNAASEATADSFQISDDEDNPLKHVEEQLRQLSEEEVEEFTSPLDKSLSPSPPHPNSLAAMSRIYNLEKKPTPVHQTTTAVVEPAKKKYPTVEEIEVIGGYQNLEKSCLIKNRGTPKRVSRICRFFNVLHSYKHHTQTHQKTASPATMTSDSIILADLRVVVSLQPSAPLGQITLCVFLAVS
uniref:Phostensin/Taperin N-terminal domain-containing protein n=1 Tax=Amphiprion ocellaris TaxID=80972 RepID=A0AAQ5ZEE8_AMPOC